jgi:hypothetical protein
LAIRVAELRQESDEYLFISKSKNKRREPIISNARTAGSWRQVNVQGRRKYFRQLPENGPAIGRENEQFARTMSNAACADECCSKSMQVLPSTEARSA